jgi:hypothetical protein
MESSCKSSVRYKDKIIAELEAIPDKKVFSVFEDDMIRKYYPTKGSAIAKVLGMTKRQISNRADHLDVKFIKVKND